MRHGVRVINRRRRHARYQILDIVSLPFAIAVIGPQRGVVPLFSDVIGVGAQEVAFAVFD
jgi:hypothetical protein